MRILALDLGTTTGWAMNTGGRYQWGSLDLKGGRYDGGGMRFVRFKNHLAELTKGVEMVVFEEVRRHLGTDAAHVYGGMLATLTAFCESRGEPIPYQGVPVGTIKKHATGKGNAKKEFVRIRARSIVARVNELNSGPRRPPIIPMTLDEADAICLLDLAVKEYGEGAA